MKSPAILRSVQNAMIAATVMFAASSPLVSQETSTPATSPAASPAIPAAMTFRLESGAPFPVRSPVDGLVKQIFAQPGSMVTTDSLLVEIDPQRLERQVEPLKIAFLNSYEAYRQTLKTDDLLKIADAKADLQACATAYDLLMFDLGQHTTRAPINGELSSVLVKPGQYVRQGDKVAEILDARRFYVNLPLLKSKARLGDQVAMILNGKLIDGTIEAVNPLSILQKSASRLSREMVTATISLENNGEMQPGQTVIPVQDAYAIVPTKSITLSPDGHTVLTVMRGNDAVEIPAVTLSTLNDGEQVVMAELQPGDLAAVPGPVANIPMTEPVTNFALSELPQIASTDQIAANIPQLLEQFPLSTPAVNQTSSETNPTATLSELGVTQELAGILTADQFPLPDLNLQPLTDELGLGPSDLLAVQQLQKEFQAMLDEKGLHIKDLDDLKDIEGVAEYAQFLSAIRALNQDYIQQMLRELPEESSQDYPSSLLKTVGLNSLPKNALSALNIDSEKISELQGQFEAEQFDLLKKLINSETTIDQARETINALLDRKDQAVIDAIPEQAKDSLTQAMKARQNRFAALAAPEQATPTPTQTGAKNAATEPAKKAPVPKFAPPPVEHETDYVMLGMFGLIGAIVLGALGYFLGIFKMLKSLMTRSPASGKTKKRKDKLKHVNRIEVGDGKAFQTIRDALSSVLENPYVKDEIPWDRHEISLDPGVYQEVVHIDESYPAGIRILSENAGQVTIVGDGKNPVIEVSAVADFGIEGLVIDGDAAPTVIQLRDIQSRFSISQVIVTGFKQFGLRITNRNSDGELNVELSETLFLSSMLETTGVFIDYGNLESSSLTIEKSRFHGPMQVGIQFRGPLHHTAIRESIFAFLGTAVSMASTSHPFQSLKLSNNSFYRCGKAMFFRRVDGLKKGERDVALDNNLFAQSEEGDLVVSDVVDAETVEATAQYIHDHSNGNLTDRGQESNFASGLISLNGKAARVFADFKFRSVEIDEPDFLMPTPDSPQRQAWSKKGALGYVGALGPKSVVRSIMEPQS